VVVIDRVIKFDVCVCVLQILDADGYHTEQRFFVPFLMDTQFFGMLRIYLECQRMQTIACSVLSPA
jgi:hypothetical protein